MPSRDLYAGGRRELGSALHDIGRRLRRLPAYDHRDPHAWHEGKDALAAELLALAAALPPGRIAVDRPGTDTRNLLRT